MQRHVCLSTCLQRVLVSCDCVCARCNTASIARTNWHARPHTVLPPMPRRLQRCHLAAHKDLRSRRTFMPAAVLVCSCAQPRIVVSSDRCLRRAKIKRRRRRHYRPQRHRRRRRPSRVVSRVSVCREARGSWCLSASGNSSQWASGEVGGCCGHQTAD